VIHALRDLPWIGEDPLFDLANTVLIGAGPAGADVDVLTDPELLRRWRQRADPRLRARDLDSLLELRDLVRHALAARAARPEDGPLRLPERIRTALNALAAGAPVTLRIDRGGQLVHTDTGGEVDAVLARDTLTLVAGQDAHRLRCCPAPSCGMFHLARRRDQTWCSIGCGNRARASRRRPTNPHTPPPEGSRGRH
jgi:predicted RNA-binding Zn ribbon-like protein